jgi:hypothetical protein
MLTKGNPPAPGLGLPPALGFYPDDADDGTHGDELWEAVAPVSVPTSPSPDPTPINEGSVFTATSSVANAGGIRHRRFQ